MWLADLQARIRYRVLEVAELGAEIAQRAARPADEARWAAIAATWREALRTGGSVSPTGPQ